MQPTHIFVCSYCKTRIKLRAKSLTLVFPKLDSTTGTRGEMSFVIFILSNTGDYSYQKENPRLTLATKGVN